MQEFWVEQIASFQEMFFLLVVKLNGWRLGEDRLPIDGNFAGDDSLAAFREIAREARSKLTSNGWLLLEHGPDQGDAVRKVLLDQGFTEVSTERDLLGHERVTGGRMGC